MGKQLYFEKKKKICGKIRTNIYRDQKKKLNQKKEDENEEKQVNFITWKFNSLFHEKNKLNQKIEDEKEEKWVNLIAWKFNSLFHSHNISNMFPKNAQQ